MFTIFELGEKTRKEVESQNCTLYHGKFLCKNKLACLDFSNVCDGRCHCLDCSDEDHQNCAGEYKFLLTFIQSATFIKMD